MSDQPPSNEPSLPAESAPEQPPKPKTNWGFQKVLLGLAIGILIGYLFTQRVTDFLPSVLPALMAVFIALFLLVIIAVLALPRIINYLAKRYTGQEVDVEAAVGDIQAKANHIADTIAGYALAKADPEVRKNIRQDLPGILHYLVFSRLRNSGLRMLMTVFVAIGGLMGTILLYNQNKLLSNQNSLLLSQNDKIDNQILLDEAARRSSLNFLLGNVLDQVNQELSDPENTKRRLSPQLIGRIASLSQSFQPYYFMEDGKMIDQPLSPERGALLLALVNSGIDTLSLYRIFEKTIFRDANLQGATLREANISGAFLSGVNLSEADLSKANLSETDLSKADLNGADLNGADLNGANLSGARLWNVNLSRADFSEANLSRADFSGAYLRKAVLNEAQLYKANLSRVDLREADLEGAFLMGTELTESRLSRANFRGATLRNANLRDADLSKANLSSADLSEVYLGGAKLDIANLQQAVGLTTTALLSCSSIYMIRGLPDSLTTLLKTEIEKRSE